MCRVTAGFRRCCSSSHSSVMLSWMATTPANVKIQWELLPVGLLFGSSCPPHTCLCGALRHPGTSALRSWSSAIPSLSPPLQTTCKMNLRGLSHGYIGGINKCRVGNICSWCALQLFLFWQALPPATLAGQRVSTPGSNCTRTLNSGVLTAEHSLHGLTQHRDHPW